MFDDLLSGFASSPHGQSAAQALQNKGYSPADAEGLLSHAIPAAAAAMKKQTEGHEQPHLGLFNIFGGHAKREFLIGLTEGLLRGDGVVGSLEDGAMSMVAGHIAEVVADRAGMNQEAAGTIAAIVTPFIVHYAHEKLAEKH